LICNDAIDTITSVEKLEAFTLNPNVPPGSDIYGALDLALANMELASRSYDFVNKTIVFASDMVDETPSRNFKRLLNEEESCELAAKDQINSNFDLSGFEVIVVGLGNSKNSISILEKVRDYWGCFFESAGADYYEASDLSDY
jgi:hypothetical protein